MTYVSTLVGHRLTIAVVGAVILIYFSFFLDFHSIPSPVRKIILKHVEKLAESNVCRLSPDTRPLVSKTVHRLISYARFADPIQILTQASSRAASLFFASSAAETEDERLDLERQSEEAFQVSRFGMRASSTRRGFSLRSHKDPHIPSIVCFIANNQLL